MPRVNKTNEISSSGKNRKRKKKKKAGEKTSRVISFKCFCYRKTKLNLRAKSKLKVN